MYIWWFDNSVPSYVEITIYIDGEQINSPGIVSRLQVVFKFSISHEYDPIYKTSTEVLRVYPTPSYPFLGWSNKAWKQIK
jgi:hypothetical protein